MCMYISIYKVFSTIWYIEISQEMEIIIFFSFTFSSQSVNSLSAETKPFYFLIHDVHHRYIIKTERREGRKEREVAVSNGTSGVKTGERKVENLSQSAGALTIFDQTREDSYQTPVDA